MCVDIATQIYNTYIIYTYREKEKGKEATFPFLILMRTPHRAPFLDWPPLYLFYI